VSALPFLRDDLAAAWRGRDPFACAQQQRGEIYRDKEGRRTLRFELGGRGYFLKLHQGIGWGEVLKNLLQGRLPVTGARNEYEAIRALERLGIDTLSVAGFGVRGANPARQLSFLVTDELTGIESLEDFCRPWPQYPPPPRLKWRLIARVAGISRTLHGAGINHRDYYLCHFLLDASAPVDAQNIAHRKLHVMDLHRAQIRARVPRRWRVKDLGALYYSALDIGLTRRDVLRFLSVYFGRPLRDILRDEAALLRDIKARAGSIYRRDFGREPRWPL
jgi:heptose I phosphotransferase